MNIKDRLKEKIEDSNKLNDCRRLDITVEMYFTKIREMMKFRS